MESNIVSLIIADGLHPPWNKGESVATKKFVELIAKIGLYDNIYIFTTVEKERLHLDKSESLKNLVKGISNSQNVKIFFIESYKDESNKYLYNWIFKLLQQKDTKIHIHFFMIPSFKFLLKLKFLYGKQIEKFFFYQFSYKSFGKMSIKSYLLPLLTLFKQINVITTSYKYYKRLGRFASTRYHLVPMPLDRKSIIGSEVSRKRDSHTKSKLSILVLTHPGYKRFPYDKVFLALKKLLDMKAKFEMTIIISRRKEVFFDFEKFYSKIYSFLYKYKLSEHVKIFVKNLTHIEKKRFFFANNIFVYSALDEVAIDPPLVVLEAMAAGMCVISTNVQSLGYMLRNERGFVIRREELIEDLYNILFYLYRNPQIIKRVSEKATNYIYKNHNEELIFNILQHIVRQ